MDEDNARVLQDERTRNIKEISLSAQILNSYTGFTSVLTKPAVPNLHGEAMNTTVLGFANEPAPRLPIDNGKFLLNLTLNLDFS